MVKQLAFAIVMAVGSLGAAMAPASAQVQNGDFTGATYLFGQQAGQIVPTLPDAYSFGSHTYVGNFAWFNTGCGCLSYIANNGGQVMDYAPANPAGYTGNIYVADASPFYDTGTYLAQVLSGLTVGKTYTLTFKQASGSYYNGTGDTAWWDVGFGGVLTDHSPDPYSLDGATVQSSAVMVNDAVTGTTPWTLQSMLFKATGESELLTFFANGTGAPPFALLADVSLSGGAVPEPATWAMMITGFAFAGVTMRRGRSRGTPRLA